MTLAPLVHPDIRGVEGKRHPVNGICAAPGCITPSAEGHHLFPRSSLRSQPQEWVRLPSGRVVSNVIGLCRRHHLEVTGDLNGHKAMIQLTPDEVFVWLTPGPEITREISGHTISVGDSWEHHGLLHPQPWSAAPVEIPQPKKKPHHHTDLEEGETCQVCGQTRPVSARNRPALPKRKRRSYTVNVPDDAEIGTDVLDDWVAQFAVLLGFGDETRKSLTRYHVLVAVLAWSMMHRDEFLSDIKEADAA